MISLLSTTTCKTLAAPGVLQRSSVVSFDPTAHLAVVYHSEQEEESFQIPQAGAAFNHILIFEILAYLQIHFDSSLHYLVPTSTT